MLDGRAVSEAAMSVSDNRSLLLARSSPISQKDSC